MEAKKIYDKWVEKYNTLYPFENKYRQGQDLQKEIALDLVNNPEAKKEIYELTLNWVNEIRANKMINQKQLDSLMPGSELEDDSCTIAKSLDERYETCVGGSMLEHKGKRDAPLSGGNYFVWYAEWINYKDENDYGWEKLPWYAYLLARSFDMGAFPELSLSEIKMSTI